MDGELEYGVGWEKCCEGSGMGKGRRRELEGRRVEKGVGREKDRMVEKEVGGEEG